MTDTLPGDEPTPTTQSEASSEPLATDELVERAVRNLADIPAPDAYATPEVTDPALEADDATWEPVPDDETHSSPSPTQDAPTSEDPTPTTSEDDDVTEGAASPLSRAADAARGAQRSVREGIEAFRSVREASQRHSNARSELESIQAQLDEHTAELQHRIDVEERYPQIVSEQTAELREAQAAGQDAQQRVATLDAERADLESQLSIMKNRHEDQLRPYRNVADSTKGRADDAARALADARRAAKSAETNLAEATKRRDQRISSANRAVDSAQERLRKIQSELDATQGDADASPAALTRLQNELVSVKAHLDSAMADVPAVTEEARQSVEAAQQRLFDQKQLLAQAERTAESAKQEAAARRSEYDGLLKQAQDEEKELSEQIKLHVTAAEQARKEVTDAQARCDAARALLDEAEAIHAAPQETIALRDQVLREQTDLSVQQDAVDELAANEKELRRGTFRQRLMLVLAGVAVLAVIVGIVAAVVLGRGRAKAKPEPVTETTVIETKRDEADDADDAADDKADSKADTKDADKTKRDQAATSASDDD